MNKTNSKRKAEFQAAATTDSMYKAEKVAQRWGPTRRVAYALMARGSEELIQGLKDEDAFLGFVEQIESLDKYLKWRKSETEILEASFARTLICVQEAMKRWPNLASLEAEAEASHG